MNRRAHLELNIDRLVLHGVSTSDRQRVADALESELQRLFTHEGIDAAGRFGDGSGPGAQSFEMPPGLAPEEIGARVARAVWASSRQAAAVAPEPESRDLAAPAPTAPSSSPNMKGTER